MSESLSDLVTRVAEYTAALDLESEDWERATAVNGLLAVEEFEDRARHWVDRAVETQTDAGQLAYGSSNSAGEDEEASRNSYNEGYFPTYNPAAMAWSALEFYDRTGEDRYLDAAHRQYEYLTEAVERTSDGGISRREGKVELFTEVYYFVCPWFVRYGSLVDRQEPIEEAVRQAKVHAKHLQDPNSGLFRHIWHEVPDFYPASSYWGRGVGWATGGLLDTLALLPDDHPERDDLVAILERTLDALVDLQDASGFWRQRLDDPQSPLEASGTLIFAYTMKAGLQEDVLTDERYETAAQRAMDACRGIVGEDGAVGRIARPPASSFSPLGTTAYGQGWFLLAASQFL
jgi:unsaturated rhamnogalacturonyl hydrolase